MGSRPSRTSVRAAIALIASGLLAQACSSAAPSVAPTEEETCTLETPLLPGVPGSPGNLIPSEINPNGASELADLMRRMEADLLAARAALETGAPLPALHPTHRRIRCAWPTDLSDRNATFDTMAQLYLRAVKRFDASGAAERREAYDAVVTGCIACHENSCPGPIPAIQRLYAE